MQEERRLKNLSDQGFVNKSKWVMITLSLALVFIFNPILSLGYQTSIQEMPEKGVFLFTTNIDSFLGIESTLEIDIPSDVSQPHPLRRRRSLRREKALIVGANLLGATMNYGSAFFGYAIGKVVNLEAGIDLTTAYGGISLHPIQFRRIEGLSPYMGLMAGYKGSGNGQKAEELYMYMPIGVRYITPDNWHISIEVAATTADNIRTGPLYGGIKLGYYFKL